MNETVDPRTYHESFYHGLSELARSRRRRRLRIGDLMVGVAIAAIGFSALGRSEAGGQRTAILCRGFLDLARLAMGAVATCRCID